MKIFVMPRDDTNPYQSLLYGEMRSLGAQVRYAFTLTPSHTVNQLLLPVEMVIQRIRGMRVVHFHWADNFWIYGSSRYPFLRRIAQTWFYLWLWTVRVTGLRLVWTAHNVLPLAPSFADDLAARRRLVAAADLVIAHSRATLAELAELGMVPRKSVVIPHGPYEISSKVEQLRPPGSTQGPRRLLFFGVIEPYKGIDALLAAFAELPVGIDAQLAVVGECRDPLMRASLTDLASRSPRPVTLRFERIPEAELPDLLQDADVVVLPYKRSSTSGSAVLALGHGRPLILPDLPGLSELPDDAVVRYDRTVQGLTGALCDLVLADASVLAKMSDAAYAYCASISWHSIARKTLDEMSQIVCDEKASE
jgi:glycosyltransferase involved in cell wall biosynthesis